MQIPPNKTALQTTTSPAMDDSIAAYARGIAPVNPAAARGSAAAITDPEKRAALLKKLERLTAPSPP